MSLTIYPTCNRAIDPYASFNSNVINMLQKNVTRGVNCLHSGPYGLDITIDSTSLTTVILGTGICYIDNVLHDITENTIIDLSNQIFYANPSTGWWNEAGYYYITYYYQYIKTQPAPRGKIQIFKPSQRGEKTSNHLFLKCVKVIFNGATFEIDELYNYDPENPSIKRIYSQLYVGIEDTLPTSFNQEEDESRIIYVRNTNQLYWGMSGRWESFQSVRDNITTTSCTVGQLGYLDHTGLEVKPAIANSSQTLANCVVLQVGTKESNGLVRLYGVADNVPVESGIVVSAGDNCYLSEITPGSITNSKPSFYGQYVGKAITDSTSTNTISLWFQPGPAGGSETGNSLYDKYQDLLQSSIFLRISIDPMINTSLIDLANTTASINYNGLHGDNGDFFTSKNLVDESSEYGYDGSFITACMICQTGTNSSNKMWFVNNDGSNPLTWEPINEDEIHWFSTAIVNIINSTGTFKVGELVTGSISGNSAVVNADWITHLLLYNISGIGSFAIGEILTGTESGATCIVSSQINRTAATDLRVYCYFSGPAYIYDYAILYEPNETLVETVPNNSRNIDTLFEDIYTTPSQDNDGFPNLATPLETQITNLISFTGSGGASSPTYSSTTIITDSADLEQTIGELDSAISLTTTIITISDGDTTPTVLDGSGKQAGILETSNTSPTSITTFDNTKSGQKIIIHFKDNNTTLVNGATMKLQGGIDFHANQNDIIELVSINNVLYEVSGNASWADAPSSGGDFLVMQVFS